MHCAWLQYILHVLTATLRCARILDKCHKIICEKTELRCRLMKERRERERERERESEIKKFMVTKRELLNNLSNIYKCTSPGGTF